MALKWPADWIIINIEGGADWLRICKTKCFFWGAGLNFGTVPSAYVPEMPGHKINNDNY
jgi:hypothetical protein